MKSFSLLLFLLTGAVLSAAPVSEKVSRTYHRHHKNYGKGEYISISNKTDKYLVYLQWIKPTAKKEGKVVIGIPEPNFWQHRQLWDGEYFRHRSVHGVWHCKAALS